MSGTTSTAVNYARQFERALNFPTSVLSETFFHVNILYQPNMRAVTLIVLLCVVASALALKNDWQFCSVSSECANNCCSKQYSGDGKLKCTPGGSQCVRSGSSSGSSTSGSSTSGSGTGSGGSSSLPSTVKAFRSPMSGIGSWFRASNSGDSTNGNSWCGYRYYNSDPVFAPDLNQMTDNTVATWGSNPTLWKKYTGIYCGLEANVTNPRNGRSMIMYIGDGFDPKWVRSPGSIDIMTDAFNYLWGSNTGNKNDVIQGVKWSLTGRKSAKYTAH
ncbi:hypothetical protein PROFUN_05414 [Planoprotostelium fungivorum]|uniref:Uncharacterized protein n=1 Tax=Planoprotostelium fungivorum TaxID=1890364 RepID=A0A2P6NQN4_9EUKA|nr:hypothetical protein PROFUN_05414 [Planoprotostelium fungivorum]